MSGGSDAVGIAAMFVVVTGGLGAVALTIGPKNVARDFCVEAGRNVAKKAGLFGDEPEKKTPDKRTSADKRTVPMAAIAAHL